jgi:hypothetical protein
MLSPVLMPKLIRRSQIKENSAIRLHGNARRGLTSPAYRTSGKTVTFTKVFSPHVANSTVRTALVSGHKHRQASPLHILYGLPPEVTKRATLLLSSSPLLLASRTLLLLPGSPSPSSSHEHIVRARRRPLMVGVGVSEGASGVSRVVRVSPPARATLAREHLQGQATRIREVLCEFAFGPLEGDARREHDADDDGRWLGSVPVHALWVVDGTHKSEGFRPRNLEELPREGFPPPITRNSRVRRGRSAAAAWGHWGLRGMGSQAARR